MRPKTNFGEVFNTYERASEIVAQAGLDPATATEQQRFECVLSHIMGPSAGRRVTFEDVVEENRVSGRSQRLKRRQ